MHLCATYINKRNLLSRGLDRFLLSDCDRLVVLGAVGGLLVHPCDRLLALQFTLCRSPCLYSDPLAVSFAGCVFNSLAFLRERLR